MSPRRRSRIVAAVLAAFSVTLATTARAETLTLQQAIDMGLQKSPNVREAKARIDSADANTAAARTGYFPTLSASARPSCAWPTGRYARL
jgi:outer membrane protein TolC